MSIAPICRSALLSPHRTCGLNSVQVRTSFYNKYKHGPTRASNPRPDYVKWTREFFGPQGKAWLLKHAKRIIRKPIDDTHFPAHYEAGKIYKFEKFDSDERFKLWKPVADSDSKNGFSISTFSRSLAGYGQFSGLIDNRLPDDGISQRSGFAGVIGPRKPPAKLYDPNPTWNWFEFNTVNIRYRGDGRTYYFIANTGRYDIDIEGYDLYAHPLHTRGGPYWQTIKIPFNRMIFVSKAFIQNQQFKMPSDVKFVGFRLQDTYDGPFFLEIDYIGLSFDWAIQKESPMYEAYAYPHMRLKQIYPGCDPPDSE